MKAPEKIYLQVCGDCPQTDCENCKFEDLENNVTWCIDKIFDKDIEYTRTDAFIEKAKKWFEKHNEWFDPNGNRHCDLEDFENFRKYMKGVDIKPFNEVYSQEQIDEIDNKILEAQRKYDSKLYTDLIRAKDFPMNN